MSRPVQPIGTFGTIAVRKVRERTFYASTRFRLQRWLHSAQRSRRHRRSCSVRAEEEARRPRRGAEGGRYHQPQPLSDVAAVWLYEVSTAERLSPQTVDAYADNLRAVLLPDLGKMRLSELTVGVLDRYFKQLAVDHPSRARRGKIVLSQVMALAVRTTGFERTRSR
jgi:hypothetical protein